MQRRQFGWMFGLGLGAIGLVQCWQRRFKRGKTTQTPQAGSGSLYRRRYWIDFQALNQSPESLVKHIKANLPDFSPGLFADFRKATGNERVMQVGDEYDIAILGPWNGSVRVCASQPLRFGFCTLEGHPEAGQIHFELKPHPKQAAAWRFEIASEARSRDGLVEMAYRIGKVVQTQVWSTFCQRVVEFAQAQQLGEIQISTIEQTLEGEVVIHD